MGRIAKDAKNLILGNDGSDKEPDDFKTELYKAIQNEGFDKAAGTILMTARNNCDKLAKLISKSEEKEIINSSKEGGKEFNSPEEAEQYLEDKKKKDKEKEDKKRQVKTQELSLEQQIQASQNEAKSKIKAEINLEKQKEIERNK